MSNEMYNTIARVTDGIYEGKVHGTSLVFFLGLFEITLDQFLFVQVLQLEEMCFQVRLFLITFCGLTTFHRYSDRHL